MFAGTDRGIQCRVDGDRMRLSGEAGITRLGIMSARPRGGRTGEQLVHLATSSWVEKVS